VIDRWEKEGRPVSIVQEGVRVEDAVKQFLQELQSRHLQQATLDKHTLTLRRLEEFCNKKGYIYLTQISLGDLREWRSSWTEGPRTSSTKLVRIKSFFKFCVENEWLEKSPARVLKSPQVPLSPTLPFTKEEMKRIYSACEEYASKREHRERMLAIVLVMRYSGLRIGDVMGLRREHLDSDGKLFLYTAKTGTPVKIPLPISVVEKIHSLPSNPSGYLFWDQQGSERILTATSNLRKSLSRLFVLARVEGGHAHRFRDTFAVELLQAGVSIETVSVLLGHSSIRVTERHYAPWVKSRQDKLEREVRKIWEEDSSDS
jgi:integrase